MMTEKFHVLCLASLLVIFTILAIGLDNANPTSAQTKSTPQFPLSSDISAAVIAAPPFKGWLALDDSDAYAQAAYQTELALPPLETEGFTVELWVKNPRFNYWCGSPAIPPVIARQSSLGIKFSCDYRFVPPDSNPRTYSVFYLFSSTLGIGTAINTCNSVSPCPPTGWYHLAYTYNKSPNNGQLFWNGTRKINSSNSLSESTNPLILRSAEAIDEVRISSIIRYTGSFAPPTAPFECDEHTLALWHFDEISGKTTFHDACGTFDNVFVGYNGAHTEGVPGYWVYLPLVVRQD